MCSSDLNHLYDLKAEPYLTKLSDLVSFNLVLSTDRNKDIDYFLN